QVKRAIPERNDVVSTLAEKLIEEGEKKGRTDTVHRLIELKFGALGRQAIARIEAADEAQLSRFMARVLTATSVEEVLGE
ncbi:MAG TPA: transposase, partial [Polyangiaceae bacterium]